MVMLLYKGNYLYMKTRQGLTEKRKLLVNITYDHKYKLSKILPRRTKQHIKKIIFNDLGGIFPSMHGWSMNEGFPINRKDNS
jgi:hypothetical protein